MEESDVPRAHDDKPSEIKVQHSAPAWMFLAAIALAFMAITSPVWLGPVINPPRHTLRYTGLIGGPNHDAFIVLNKDSIRPGEVVQMQVSACNDSNRPLGISVERHLVSVDREGTTEPVFFDDIHGTWPPGCSPTLISQAHVVPLGTRPGRYYLKGVTTPDDGSIPLDWQSDVFTVVP
jgi:hypothetical protein